MRTLKGILFLTIFACAISFTNAQEGPTGKDGSVVLPESGDWAISFDATPFLNYAGNLFNAGAVAPVLGYTNGYPWSVKGKLFVSSTMAYRAGIRIGFGNNTYVNEIIAPQVAAFIPVYPGTPNPMVEDEYKAGYTNIVVTGGLELRRGHGRLQGFYGGELIFGMGGSSNSWTYGNALSSGDVLTLDPNITVANSTDWTTINPAYTDNTVLDDFGLAARLTESKSSGMTFGLRGFIGVEYFVFPKIAIGGEYGWGFGMTSATTTSSMESVGISAGTTQVVGTFDTETKTSGMAIDSDIQNGATGLLGPAGSLNITFCF